MFLHNHLASESNILAYIKRECFPSLNGCNIETFIEDILVIIHGVLFNVKEWHFDSSTKSLFKKQFVQIMFLHNPISMNLTYWPK